MFAQIPERRMHWIRWVVTTGWLLLILSLFYDPWTAALTAPGHPWSPLRLTGECIQVQGICVEETPQPIGATLFWGAIVPSGIFILLVFSHELWRRICPLSFLSQIPRALGWQRQFKRQNAKTGKVRYELAKVPSESWLGRNYQYVQFAYLFVGLCGRILFFNADRLVLGSWLVFTIGAAIAVGYLYGGKSWCQYFCPMAPVQTVFSEPRGLMGSKAHTSESRVTQSMCRTVDADGSEKSACVACQSPCFDIDSERSYWDGLHRRDEAIMRYGYLGLMVGYFLYYYLYAGNWDYYFSGVWNRDPDQLGSLMNPGLYLAGQAIAIPKLLAVPLVLGAFTLGGIGLGTMLTQRAKTSFWRKSAPLGTDLIQHRAFAIVTFIAFNFFFFFAGRPLLLLLPGWVQFGFDGLVLFLSTLWLQQSWRRSPDRYTRENLASRLRKQLTKLDLNVAPVLDGRSLDDLSADEVYVLAKVLPDFTRDKRHRVYKGVVRDALEEGYINGANSLDVLRQMRQELGLSDDEHRAVLEELGIEDPALLNPDRQRSLENLVRLSGYQRSLERLLRLQQANLDPRAEGSANPALDSLQREYSITLQEEGQVLADLGAGATETQRAEGLLAQLREWMAIGHALTLGELQSHRPVVALVQEALTRRQGIILRSLLTTLTALTEAEALPLAQTLVQMAPSLLAEVAEAGDLPGAIASLLPSSPAPVVSPPPLAAATIDSLKNLLDHPNPLIPAAALFLLAQLDAAQATAAAAALTKPPAAAITQTTARQVQALGRIDLADVPPLEQVVYLFNSDFFHRLEPSTLMGLARLSTVNTYAPGDTISDAGDTCRELLILIEGNASIHYRQEDGTAKVEGFITGQVLDELEVLTQGILNNAIVADSEPTRILAVPVDAIDTLLDQDPDFARRVIALESQRLQQLTTSLVQAV